MTIVVEKNRKLFDSFELTEKLIPSNLKYNPFYSIKQLVNHDISLFAMLAVYSVLSKIYYLKKIKKQFPNQFT